MTLATAGLQMGSAATSLTSTGSASSVQPKVVAAAHDFEAMMMKELLKPMTSNSLDGDQEDRGDLNSGSALGDYASEALGRALSQQGGFGIANKIIGSFSHSGNLEVTGTVTKLGTSNTVIGSNK
jgi:Rod binding domain-containing protein